MESFRGVCICLGFRDPWLLWLPCGWALVFLDAQLIRNFPWCMHLSGLPWCGCARIVLEATTHMGLISVMSSFLDVSIGASHLSIYILLGSDQYVTSSKKEFSVTESSFCGKLHDFGLKNPNLHWIAVPTVLRSPHERIWVFSVHLINIFFSNNQIQVS